MTVLPPELVVYLFEKLQDYLKDETLATAKQMRLVCRFWARLGEQQLRLHSIKLAAKVDSHELSSAFQSHFLTHHIRELGFDSGDADLIRRLVSECLSVKEIGLVCTVTFPPFAPAMDRQVFRKIKGLMLSNRTDEVPLSHLTRVMSCFISIDKLDILLSAPVERDRHCQVDLPNLKRVKIVDNADKSDSHEHLLRRLLVPTCLRRVRNLTVGDLETALEDRLLLAITRPTLTGIGFVNRYSQGAATRGLNLVGALADFVNLDTLNLTEVADVRTTLVDVVENIPHQVRVIIAEMSGEDMRVSSDVSHVRIPFPHPSGFSRILFVKVVDHETRRPLKGDDKQMNEATDASGDFYTILTEHGISVTFLDERGGMSWRTKVEVDDKGNSYISLPDLGPPPGLGSLS